MNILIVCWAEGNGTPGLEIFTDIDQAMQCLRYMAEHKSAAIIRRIELRREEPEHAEDPRARAKAMEPDAEPAEDTEAAE